MTIPMFRGECSTSEVADELDSHHYLGEAGRGWAWSDDRGVVVLGPPTSRMLPASWLELRRWCLRGGKNDGSRQWAELRTHILATRPECTTVVSYSDPAAGHDGALYRACNWLWAPTWHRLRPPPTGGGTWDGVHYQTVKDRWVCPLRPDPDRLALLLVGDESILRRMPESRWVEPRFRRGIAVPGTGGVPLAVRKTLLAIARSVNDEAPNTGALRASGADSLQADNPGEAGQTRTAAHREHAPVDDG